MHWHTAHGKKPDPACTNQQTLSAFIWSVADLLRGNSTFAATIKIIGMSDVKSLVTPVPPLVEQV